jgi:hypothetical protein
MRSCWDAGKEARPGFEELSNILAEILRTVFDFEVAGDEDGYLDVNEEEETEGGDGLRRGSGVLGTLLRGFQRLSMRAKSPAGKGTTVNPTVR